MTQFELIDILEKKRIQPAQSIILDSQFVRPSKKWLFGDFQKSFADNLIALGLQNWAEEKWDCDDFALLAKAMAGICHARTSGNRGMGLATGLFCYESPRGPHGIMLSVVEDDVVFFEPQRAIRGDAQVELTKDEVDSCFAYVI